MIRLTVQAAFDAPGDAIEAPGVRLLAQPICGLPPSRRHRRDIGLLEQLRLICPRQATPGVGSTVVHAPDDMPAVEPDITSTRWTTAVPGGIGRAAINGELRAVWFAWASGGSTAYRLGQVLAKPCAPSSAR